MGGTCPSGKVHSNPLRGLAVERVVNQPESTMTHLPSSSRPVTARPEPDPTDVVRARGGDPEAFERLYRATVARIHGLARRMAGAELADDLTQEVYLRAWTRLNTFRGEARFFTWLHRLAVNLIISRRISIRRRESRFAAAGDWLQSLKGRVATPGLRMDLERAIDTLPDGAREVFVLYDVEGYRHQEIGELLGISVGTSKSQLHRARMLLREQIDR